MARTELIDRWRAGNLRTEVLRRLAGGCPLLDLELPVVDGLLDLRGFPAGGLDSPAATIAGVDFRHATRSSSQPTPARDHRTDHRIELARTRAGRRFVGGRQPADPPRLSGTGRYSWLYYAVGS